jgi:hypothetical protein
MLCKSSPTAGITDTRLVMTVNAQNNYGNLSPEGPDPNVCNISKCVAASAISVSGSK